MARIRSVKPELRESDLVATWPFEVRYFWVLFWGYLDDSGRGLDLPKRIAGDCFPKDDAIDAAEIDSWLNLMSRGFGDEDGPVCRYSWAGKRYVHSVNWGEHQKPNRPTPSRLPRCPVHDGRPSTGLSTPLSTTSGQLTIPGVWDESASGDEYTQVGSLSESVSEHALSDSVPRAAEQQSRGAVEQQHALHESRTNKSTDGMRKTVREATDATEAEAEAIIAIVEAERRPRNLGAFLRTLAKDGDLAKYLIDVRTAANRINRSRHLEAARDGPECEHGVAGGEAIHPDTREPLCPGCRMALRRAAA